MTLHSTFENVDHIGSPRLKSNIADYFVKNTEIKTILLAGNIPY